MSDVPINKTICPKCGYELNIHAPLVVSRHDANMSQVSLIPSWSTDERHCPGCKSIVAPRIKSIDLEIIAYDPPKEQTRIQLADAGLLNRLQPVAGRKN